MYMLSSTGWHYVSVGTLEANRMVARLAPLEVVGRYSTFKDSASNITLHLKSGSTERFGRLCRSFWPGGILQSALQYYIPLYNSIPKEMAVDV